MRTTRTMKTLACGICVPQKGRRNDNKAKWEGQGTALAIRERRALQRAEASRHHTAADRQFKPQFAESPFGVVGHVYDKRLWFQVDRAG